MSVASVTNGKVSVVIPTYNRAYCLPATLQSLQQQTHANWEAVVIDDGSTDDTPRVLEQLSGQDSRIRYQRQVNRGVSAARNAGLRLATGDWIGFLDSDDWWEPWKLEAQVACLQRLPDVGMVWTDMNAVDSAGTLVSSMYLRKFYSAYRRFGNRRMFERERPFSELAPEIAQRYSTLTNARVSWGDVYAAMMVGSLVHTSTVLLTRQRLQAVGFFNEGYTTGEDYDFHLRTCRQGRVALLDAPTIRYRIAGGADQLTSTAHRVAIARNALKTRQAAIAHDRARIALSGYELHQIIADAHMWLADELIKIGDFGAARPHFFRSLWRFYREPRFMIKAALVTMLPASWARALLRRFQSGR
jgi:glycosyltransferase involved in cell wall biosynthesis